MFSLAHQFLQTKLQERVEVTEENNRNICLFPHVANEVEDLEQAKAMTQRAFGGALDDRPISHRIGKRHTEFDHARASTREFNHQLSGSFEIRISGCNERDEAFFVLSFQARERFRN